MGILGSLFNLLFNAANTVQKGLEDRASDYDSGYERGSQKASRMSDDELRSSLKRAKEGGVSDWKSAGKVRAMADEYKNRK